MARQYIRKTIASAHKIRMVKNLKGMGWNDQKISKFFEDTFKSATTTASNITVSYPKDFKDFLTKKLTAPGAQVLLVVGNRGRIRAYKPGAYEKMQANGKRCAQNKLNKSQKVVLRPKPPLVVA